MNHYKNKRSLSKDKKGSRNETAQEFKDNFFSFGGKLGSKKESTSRSPNKSLNRVRFEDTTEYQPMRKNDQV